MKALTALLILCVMQRLNGQNIELMPGTKRIFADVQWLAPIGPASQWTVFSRSRATVDYHENTDLFTGAYLNYTTGLGVGGTIVGRISGLGAGGDAGVHYFIATSEVMLYALASVAIESSLRYSWFSILRLTPSLSDKWDLYTSLELFSNMSIAGHVASVQRMRLGLRKNNCQFGLALNLAGYGKGYTRTDINPGIFIRNQF